MTTLCQRCGYRWQSRVAIPKECPGCKSRYWRSKGAGTGNSRKLVEPLPEPTYEPDEPTPVLPVDKKVVVFLQDLESKAGTSDTVKNLARAFGLKRGTEV